MVAGGGGTEIELAKQITTLGEVRIYSHLCIVKIIFRYTYGKCSKISNTILILFSKRTLVIRAGIHKMLVTIANKETLIRLLLKQSNLGLSCLFRPL